MSGVFQIGGLASGLDTNAIIDALVDVERNKIRLVQSQQLDYEVKLSAYGSLIGKLNEFETAAKTLNEQEYFEILREICDKYNVIFPN